jgi:heme oxygenase (biliverdin-IX-beta and delta-forming)
MNSAHQFLREATAPHHGKVDAAFGSFNLADLNDYRRFLLAQAKAYIPVEDALERAGAGELLEDWSDRRRSGALIADLHRLGSDVPAPLPPPPLDSEAAIWGALYVLEGSRLGGRTLAPSVAEGTSRGFLDHRTEKGAWRKLLDRLNQRLINDKDRGMAASTAQAVFELFENAAKAVSKA